jgi:tetratricopeptide (TPR) repeat protein
VAQDKDEQSNFSDILSNLINDKTLHPNKLYDVLENLLNKTTKNQPEIYLAQAKILINQKDYSASEKKIKKALEIKPEWIDALFLEANVAFLENDYARAKRLLNNENLSNAYAEKAFYKELLAQTLIKTSDFVQAEPIYQWLINQVSPKNEHYLALALTQLKLKKEDSAKKILQMLTEKEKTVWQSAANFYLAQIEEKHQNLSKAIILYDKVVEGDLTFDAGISSVNLLVALEKYGLADEHLQLLLSRFPNHRSRLTLMRASLYNLQNQPEKSFNIVSDSIEKLPDDQHLLYAKALLAKHLKKSDAMESSLKRILAKSPNDIDALNMLGYRLLEESQRYAEAEKYLQKAKELSHNDPAIMDSFGWLEFKKGNIQSALKYLQMAYENSDNSDIAVHLSQIMWILDKQEESKKILQLALKKSPENAELLSIQKKQLDR